LRQYVCHKHIIRTKIRISFLSTNASTTNLLSHYCHLICIFIVVSHDLCPLRKDIILTAGHVDPPPTQAVRVRLNHTSFAHTDFAQEPDDDETFSIVHKEHHPKYAYIGWDERIFDFNIFKISGLSNVKPVKLNTNPNIPKPGQIVTVIGMGSTKPDPETFVSSAATTLQEVDLTILSQQQCEASADPNRPGSAYKGRVYETIMVCSSGGKHNEKDACAFDSGSPLLLTPSNSKNVTEDTVVALVSWGEVGSYLSLYDLCND